MQVLWEEVKAYTNIISEMHMLEFGGDDENGSPGSPTNDTTLNNNYNESSRNDNHNNRTNLSNGNGVPLLILKKNALSSSSSGSSTKASTISSNETNFRPKSSPNSKGFKDDHMRVNSGDTKKKTNNNNSSPNSINSQQYKGKQEEESLDSVDFILSIRDYLTTDRVGIVVEKIRAALDLEKTELNSKMKQLESSMEMDCEVIVTNRSSNRSNKSTPRIDPMNIFSVPSYDKNSKNETYYSDSKASDRGSERGSISNRSNADRFDVCAVCGVDVDIDDPATARSKESDIMRSKGSSDWNDYTNNDLRGASSSSSRSKSGNDGTSASPLEYFCFDCKGRNRREKILGGRLPKVEPSSSSRVTSYMDDKKEKNEIEIDEFCSASGLGGGKEQSNSIDKFKQPSSKFKNRLQAARDEHHFMADDYLS